MLRKSLQSLRLLEDSKLVRLLVDTTRAFARNRLITEAAGISMYELLAVFPAVAAFAALYGLFADVKDAEHQIEALAGLVPRRTIQLVGAQMIRISSQEASALQLAFLWTLALWLWSANAGMRSLLNALNIAFESKETRGFLRLTAHAFLFTTGGLVFMGAGISAVVAIPGIFPFIAYDAPWVEIVRWPAVGVSAAAALSILYRYGPCRPRSPWTPILQGAAVTAILWMAGSAVFSWYLRRLANYGQTYGSFGAAAGGITWLWVSTIIVLFGATLTAEIDRASSAASTVTKTSQSRPLRRSE